jgi:ABC-type sugar transport system ATPase subunit
VHALVEDRLELWRGEVHALCDGKGAGKSTVLNVSMGLITENIFLGRG